MLATLTLVIFRENAAVMRGAKYYFRQVRSETRDRNPAPRMGRPHDSRRATLGGPPVRPDLRALMLGLPARRVCGGIYVRLGLPYSLDSALSLWLRS
jgi:hypothetical protein